ncbi:L-asparagine transporter-like permease [Actinomadura algeriensis]|uniref:L-asparagine transporter-like permease n=1 Tax=Actinomadura algeriensis TaxID=1679523 RepID=A0ABR9JNM3_9ACTN|nr:L-asparagine transporter-like permease [Actinomadura algeriensis]
MVDGLPGREEGYQRGLGTRQIQMLAIGGTIGTGLFLGAGANIAKAGPSLVLTYAVAGVMLFFVMRALGELLTYRRTEGVSRGMRGSSSGRSGVTRRRGRTGSSG